MQCNRSGKTNTTGCFVHAFYCVFEHYHAPAGVFTVASIIQNEILALPTLPVGKRNMNLVVFNGLYILVYCCMYWSSAVHTRNYQKSSTLQSENILPCVLSPGGSRATKTGVSAPSSGVLLPVLLDMSVWTQPGSAWKRKRNKILHPNLMENASKFRFLNEYSTIILWWMEQQRKLQMVVRHDIL